jgi:hypothetical protein
MQFFVDLITNLYKNRRQRRQTIGNALALLDQSDGLLIGAVFFVVFVLPLLFNSILQFDLPAWLWWVKQHSRSGLMFWIVLRVFIVVRLAPTQVVSATVDAMEQTSPTTDPTFSGLTERVEVECLPYTKPLEPAEQKIGRQAYWRQQWRRPGRRLLFSLPLRRPPPRPSLSLESSH